MIHFAFLYGVALANLALGFYIALRLWPNAAPRG